MMLRVQILRYAATGVALSLLYSAIYWGLASPLAVAPLLANSAAFVATTAAGYAIHSRWSFAGRGRRSARARLIFALVNLAAFALNSVWVWAITGPLHGGVELPLIPILLVTPWLSFFANRQWAFRA